MLTQSNRTQSSPQADGDSRPFDTHGRNGAVRVHVEKRGPFTSPKLATRDRELTTLVEPMARLLYRAMQVQALGVIDHVLFEDLPVVTKAQLIADAREALHRQSTLYRHEAERAVKVEFHDALKAAALHYPYLNPVADDFEQARRQKAIDHVCQFMQLLDIPRVMLDAERRAMTTPLRMGPRAQETLTVVRGGRDGF